MRLGIKWLVQLCQNVHLIRLDFQSIILASVNGFNQQSITMNLNLTPRENCFQFFMMIAILRTKWIRTF